jgi:hypothetical protein
MEYKITGFNPYTGSALVNFFTAEFPEGLTYNVDVPVENGSYISGDVLRSHIMAFAPYGQIARIVELRDNPPDRSDIESLVQPLPSPGPVVMPERTQKQIQDELVAAVQYHLDSVARSRGYDGILSLTTYAASTISKFASEGAAGLVWRDAVWSHCWSVLSDVQNGLRTIPTPQLLIAELPQMAWPD